MPYTYNSTNGSVGFGLTTREAVTEKADMQCLNDRLANYIQKVREMKAAADRGLDPTAYKEAMRQLESEVLTLKGMYETELEKLRRALEDSNRQRTALATENNQLKQTVADLQRKLSDESNRAKKAEDDANNLRRHLAAVQKDLTEAKAALSSRDQGNERMGCELHKLRAENEDLKKRLADETKAHHDATEKYKHLTDKNKFDTQVADQTQRDLNERIRAANDIIQTLELKLKQLNKMGDNLPGILQKLRDGTVADLKRYQKETEEALNRNISALKNQMDEEARAKDRLEKERRDLEEQLRRLQAANHDLEGQIKALKASNNALQSELEKERARAQQAIRDLEQRLRELQEQLMSHSKEFVNARDAQASLRTEIETYRALLDAEGQRLKTPVGGGAGYAGGAAGESTQSYQPRQCTTGRAKTPAYMVNHSKGLPDINANRPSSKQGMDTKKGPQLFYNSYNTTYRHDYTPKRRGRYA